MGKPATLPTVDPEFAAVFELPPEAEWERLRQKIEAEPYFEPLVVWDEENILLDGHTRLAVCERYNLTGKITTRRLSFPDRAAAWQWVVDNQLARRNLSTATRMYYIGLEYNAAKEARGGDRANRHGDGLPAAKRIAKKRKVSARTVERAGKVAEAVENLPPKERKKAIAGGGKLSARKLAAQAGPRKAGDKTYKSWRAVPLLELVKVTAPVKKALDAMGIDTCGDWADALDAGTIRGLRPTDVRDIQDHVAELRAPAPEKNGKQAGVNWPAFYSHYGAVVRAVSDFHRGNGTLNGADHAMAKAQIGSFLDLFKAQVSKATGKPVPTH